MARITKKGLSGSAGPAVFFTMFGNEYVKGKANRINKKLDDLPENQQRQANNFKYVMNTIKPFKSFFRIGFKAEAVNCSTFGEAMHVNLDTFLDVDQENPVDELNWVIASKGTRANATGLHAEIIDGKQLSISWTGVQANRSAEDDDVVMVALTTGRTKTVQSVMSAGRRSAGKVVVNLEEGYQNMPLQCFIAFRSKNFKKPTRKDISTSKYFHVDA